MFYTYVLMLKRLLLFGFIPFLLALTIYLCAKYGVPRYRLYSENKALRQTIQPLFKNTEGTYGVVVKDLKTGAQYTFNEHRTFATASLYKLWIMAETYEQIKEHKITEDDIVSDDVASMNQNFGISSDSADLTDGVITLRIADALNQMITISHNYAALLLTEQLHESTINDFLTKQQ
jgi:beta-lactamase class A